MTSWFGGMASSSSRRARAGPGGGPSTQTQRSALPAFLSLVISQRRATCCAVAAVLISRSSRFSEALALFLLLSG